MKMVGKIQELVGQMNEMAGKIKTVGKIERDGS